MCGRYIGGEISARITTQDARDRESEGIEKARKDGSERRDTVEPEEGIYGVRRWDSTKLSSGNGRVVYDNEKRDWCGIVFDTKAR